MWLAKRTKAGLGLRYRPQLRGQTCPSSVEAEKASRRQWDTGKLEAMRRIGGEEYLRKKGFRGKKEVDRGRGKYLEGSSGNEASRIEALFSVSPTLLYPIWLVVAGSWETYLEVKGSGSSESGRGG